MSYFFLHLCLTLFRFIMRWHNYPIKFLPHQSHVSSCFSFPKRLIYINLFTVGFNIAISIAFSPIPIFFSPKCPCWNLIFFACVSEVICNKGTLGNRLSTLHSCSLPEWSNKPRNSKLCRKYKLKRLEAKFGLHFMRAATLYLPVRWQS